MWIEQEWTEEDEAAYAAAMPVMDPYYDDDEAEARAHYGVNE